MARLRGARHSSRGISAPARPGRAGPLTVSRLPVYQGRWRRASGRLAPGGYAPGSREEAGHASLRVLVSALSAGTVDNAHDQGAGRRQARLPGLPHPAGAGHGDVLLENVEEELKE